MRILRSRKGKISLILACLMILAITVVAFVVVYMFMSGAFATMLSGEKVTVQSAIIAPSESGTEWVVEVGVEQTGGPQAVVTSLIIKDSAGNTIADIHGTGAFFTSEYTTIPLTQGKVTAIDALFTSQNIETGKSYTVTVVTAAGASFVSPRVVVS